MRQRNAIILAFLAALISSVLFTSRAQAQQNPVQICYYVSQFVCQPVSGSTPFPTTGPFNIAPVPCSGTIASGNVAQNALAASTTRHGFQIFNVDLTEPLWIRFNGTAQAGGVDSYPLAPGGSNYSGAGSYYSQVGFSTAVSVVAATPGHVYACTTW